MSLYVDKKFVSLLSPKLEQFKQRGEFLWNFRCPVCGDSHKDKLKARGYVYKRKDRFAFMCHNCGASMSLPKFIKFLDPHLYNEYQMETFVKPDTSKGVKVTDFMTKPTFNVSSAPRSILLTDAKSIGGLSDNHPARRYLDDRKVPINNLYYVDDFAAFIKNLFPEYDKKLYNEARIIIPFYDKDGNLLGVQGRSIGPSKIKYITIKSSDESPKIFGWDKVDTNKRIYVVEGPIDSLFLENCVATMDANLTHAISVLGIDKNYVFVYDCEPRNKNIVSHMRKTIEMGKDVCIWPQDTFGKDINEMFLCGMPSAAIQHIIDNNTYNGLMATMKLNQWSKV